MSIFPNGKGYEFTRNPKISSHSKEKTSRKRMIMMKDENEKDEKIGKHYVDGEVLQLIGLRGKMELEFSKIQKKIKIYKMIIIII
jgi:hypothetical protein